VLSNLEEIDSLTKVFFFFSFAEQLGTKNKTILHQTTDNQKSEYICYLLRAFLYLTSTAEPKDVSVCLTFRQWQENYPINLDGITSSAG
jgi:hypothetical protein